MDKAIAWLKAKPALMSAVGAAALTAMLLLISFAECEIAPFGGNSLAAWDADIQYLDFFAYFKDVLLGQNSIDYTFSSYLGGNTLGLYSYYLASPFSLLVLFFPDDQLPLFFDVISLLKLTLAATIMSFCLARRFEMDFRRIPFCILLGVSYALSAYGTHQISNTMWLDAMYMLPVILLGVHRILQQERIWVFSVSAGLALIFNWYAGAIAVLFSAFWACFEMLILQVRNQEWNAKKRWRVLWQNVVRYLIALLVGIAFSAVLLLPTIAVMQGSSKGSLELGLLRDLSFRRQLPTLVQNYTVGGESTATQCSLYCGAFALIGCLGAVFASAADRKLRWALGVCVLVVALIFCWSPFVYLFLLLINSASYWVRSGFVGEAAIVFLAGWYFLSPKSGFGDTQKTFALARAVLLFAGLQILLEYVAPGQGSGLLTDTLFAEIGMLLVVVWYIYQMHTKRICIVILAIILVFCSCDLANNAKNQFVISNNVASYSEYQKDKSAWIKMIRSMDPAPDYRIAQTFNWRNSVANQNEALGYGYKSLGGYSSIADTRQIKFMADLGFNDHRLAIAYASPIITADSLLGVKYVIADFAIRGFVAGKIPSFGGAQVYENPFCLPMAFVTSEEVASLDDQAFGDPFETTNALYDALSGTSSQLYSEVGYTEVKSVDASGATVLTYTLEVPQGNYALYGQLPGAKGALDANGQWQTSLSNYIIAGAFYIPASSNDGTATVTLTTDSPSSLREARFRALDLDALKAVTKEIGARGAQVKAFQNGHAEFEADAGANQYLYVSIPADDGWTITVNGAVVEPEYVLDCLYLIPLQTGHNTVVMNYHGPNMIPGLLLTLAAIGCLVALGIRRRKNSHGTKLHFSAGKHLLDKR